jgi:hypothetical protein
VAKADSLFNLFMPCVLAAARAKLLEFQPLRGRLSVFGRRVIALFAITAL